MPSRLDYSTSFGGFAKTVQHRPLHSPVATSIALPPPPTWNCCELRAVRRPTPVDVMMCFYCVVVWFILGYGRDSTDRLPDYSAGSTSRQRMEQRYITGSSCTS